jgi:hypothetical protein
MLNFIYYMEAKSNKLCETTRTAYGHFFQEGKKSYSPRR